MTYRIFNPKRIEENYISNDIEVKYDVKNGYKIISKNNIKKGTIIIKEIPYIDIFGETIIKEENELYEIREILNKMVNNFNNNEIMDLYPRIRMIDKDFIKSFKNPNNPYNLNLKDIKKIIGFHSSSKYKKRKIFDLDLNFDLDYNIDLDLYYDCYMKYLFNAFDMYNSPVILPLGAKINHSDIPNIYFYEKNNAMYFETIKNIKLGEEITYSYLRNYNNEEYKNKITKKEYLAYHYNFMI